MKIIDTYYIKRNETFIWLAQGVEPLETDEVIEVRPMLIADEGKTLWKDNEEYPSVIWLKDTVESDYEERDIVEEEEDAIFLTNAGTGEFNVGPDVN